MKNKEIMMNVITKTIDLGDGRTITVETGKLAKQADGSVEVRMGDTMILATAVSAKEAKTDVDFMPLTVDYREKYAGAGRFPGGFTKREGRPSDDEILVARLVDRALRPLFPSDFHAETVVMLTLFSVGEGEMPDQLAGLAASAAIAVSDIPFDDYVSEVRAVRVDGEFIINPNREQLAAADMDIMVAATYDNIMMVEGEFDEVSEAEMLQAIKVAHEAIKAQCTLQKELAEAVGLVKREYCHEQSDEELKQLIWDKTYDACYAVAKSGTADKHKRFEMFGDIKAKFVEEYSEGKEESDINKFLLDQYYHDVEKEAVRRVILDEGIRLDGRKTTEIRPIWGEVDYLSVAHGSSVFTRGETQALATVTLGTKMDEKLIDNVTVKGKERFLLHYNFPPFCTGEARTPRGTSRREIGHGNLAFRALKGMLPDDFPYVIRIVSDVLESNGSSSMATTCAGSMALLDAGVPIKKPVTGIAMGLITDKGAEKFAVLSDILGDEDHLGDMDFKVTGTVDGITATQMDIKVDGLPYEVLEQALAQARDGRLHIMGEVNKVISEPRDDYKESVPRIVSMDIPKDMIGAVIGPGGKIIQQIQQDSGAVITIEEVGDKGVVQVVSSDKTQMETAIGLIKNIVAIPEVGEIYKGKVKSIVAFGAFVEIMPGKDGLLHISEVDWKRLDNLDGILKEGDAVDVQLIGVDERSGKLKLSRKSLLEKPEGYVEPVRRPRREGDRRPRRD